MRSHGSSAGFVRNEEGNFDYSSFYMGPSSRENVHFTSFICRFSLCSEAFTPFSWLRVISDQAFSLSLKSAGFTYVFRHRGWQTIAARWYLIICVTFLAFATVLLLYLFHTKIFFVPQTPLKLDHSS
jgi:hypothetical protein